MRNENAQAQITISYQTCCFCDKPIYPAGKPVAYYPRFEFRKAAKEYAKQHNLTIFSWGKNKCALAYTNFACNHNENNIVRIDWGIVFTRSQTKSASPTRLAGSTPAQGFMKTETKIYLKG